MISLIIPSRAFCQAFMLGLLALLIATEAQGSKDADGLSCKIEFSDKEAKLKVAKDCADKHKFKLDVNNESLEYAKEIMKDLKSKDFEDGCFTKCWYDEMGLLEKDGKVKTDSFDVFYKTSNITEPLLKEFRTLFEDCLKVTEASFKDAKEVPCKMYVMTEYCVHEKIMENKKHLDEICKGKN